MHYIRVYPDYTFTERVKMKTAPQIHFGFDSYISSYLSYKLTSSQETARESQTLGMKRNIPFVNQQPNFPDKTEVKMDEMRLISETLTRCSFHWSLGPISSKFHNSLSKQILVLVELF